MTIGLIIGVVTLASPSSAESVVRRTVDGDTLVIEVGGREERVRLLNVDTPETKDPAVGVECLGVEAAAFTEHLAPRGTKVNLVYDTEKRDRYGRLLAAVHLADGRSIGDEIARAGLGVPVVFAPNRSQLAAVTAAQQEAIENEVGFFDPAEDCTVPAQHQAALVGLSGPAAPPVTSQLATGEVLTLVAALEGARAFLTLLENPGQGIVWSIIPAPRLAGMALQLRSQIREGSGELRKLNVLRTKLVRSEKRAEARRVAAVAARKAAREARRRAAQAAAAARVETRERADAVARERAEAAQQAQESQSDSGGDSGGSGSGASEGYTGPRCYDPGGVTWHPC